MERRHEASMKPAWSQHEASMAKKKKKKKLDKNNIIFIKNNGAGK